MRARFARLARLLPRPLLAYDPRSLAAPACAATPCPFSLFSFPGSHPLMCGITGLFDTRGKRLVDDVILRREHSLRALRSGWT